VSTAPRSAWSPRLWGYHLALLVVLAATVSLGYWQWHVSQGRKASQVASEAHATPVALSRIYGHDEAFPDSALGKPALITGTWVDSGTVYVRRGDHYWVATPIAVGGATRPAIYVVRGSSPTPTAPAVHGSTTVVAWLEPEMQGDSAVRPHSDILPVLQMTLAAPHVRQDLYDGLAIVADREAAWPDPTANDGTTGLTPVAAPLPKADTTTGLRNLLYAFEWWAFGMLAIYMWWQMIQDRLHPGRRQRQPASEATQDDVVPSKP
jgi:surfeit locus 1 family protein